MQPQVNIFKAAAWMIGALLSLSTMAVCGRELSSSLDTFEIMMYRSFLGIFIVVIVAKFAGTLGEINMSRIGLHGLRNMAHFAGQNLWFYAIAFIPLSQLFAFEFTTPLWVALMAPFFLNERLTPVRIIAAALGFAGIYIVARPDFSNLSPAMIAAACCAIGFAFAYISTKMLTSDQSITCILFWLVVIQAVFGVICAGYDGQISLPHGFDILLVLTVGICGLSAHFCITRALSLAPAVVVTPLDFLRLPLIIIIGFVLYNEPFEWSVLIGALIVFGANLLNIILENRKNASAPN